MDSNYIVFDVETAPMDRDTILTEAAQDVHVIKLGNRKDPDKIKEVQDKYWQELIDNAALHPTTGTVLCAGLYYSADDQYKILQGTEQDVLVEFWKCLVYPERYVGFNILAFDLPFVCRRCWHHGIPVPAWVFDGRYFSRHFIDLMEYWRLGNRQDMISLDKFSKFMGFPGKKVNGKDFADRYIQNQGEALDYLKHDLWITAQIAKRIQP